MKVATLILATVAGAVFAVVCVTNFLPVSRQAAHESLFQGAVLAFYYLLIPALLFVLTIMLPAHLLRKSRRGWALAAAIALFVLAAPAALFELFLLYG